MVRHCIAFGCQNRSSKAECKDLSWHLLPLSNKNLLAQWLVKLRREDTPVNKNSYVCSQHFEPNCFIKPMGGQRIRLKPDSVPTKFIFTVEKPKRKKPADRASLNTKKTTTERSQPYSVSEPVNTEQNVENTDFKSGSGGIETKRLESEDLVQTGEENWEHQLKLKDDEMSCLLEKWQTKERELNKKIQVLENQLEEERSARKELELLIEKKAFSIETVKDNDKLLRFYTGFQNYEVFSMVLDFLGRETAAHLDYHNTENLGEIKHKYKPGPYRALTVENEFFLVLCRLKVGLLEEDLSARFGVCQSVLLYIRLTMKNLIGREHSINSQ